MERVRLGETVVELASGRVETPDGAYVLPDREREILVLLAREPGEILPREALGGGGPSRAADMAVSRLRKSLGAAGRRIATVRGRGYRLEIDDERSAPALDLGWGRLETEIRRVRLRDRVVRLTEQQTRLLEILAKAPGTPLARADVSRGLWGSATRPERLDLLVHRLRVRLEDDPAHPRFVISLRGRGLVLLDARPAGTKAAAPVRAGDLVGRDAELSRVAALLDDDARRVLVHGPPGIGKSALARSAVAAWTAGLHPQEHAFVDLHGVRDAREAEGRLVAALGMEDLSDDDVVQRALGARGELLLVVDGALPEELAARLGAWIDAVPTLHALVAARDPAKGWPVVELGGLSDADARTLLERTAGHPLDDSVDRICRRVDGNPLALELLGKGLRTASAADVYRRLEVPLTPLRRAWKAALDDLSDADRRCVLALSAFRRPFAGDDVGPVAGLDRDAATGAVDRLVGRSVLQRTDGDGLQLPLAARELLRADLRRHPDRRTLREAYRARSGVVLARIVGAIETRGGPALDELELRWPDLDASLDVGETGPPGDPVRLAELARRCTERVPKLRREHWSECLLEAAARDDVPAADRAACLRAVHTLDWADMTQAERGTMLRQALAFAVAGDDAVRAAAVAAELASIVGFTVDVAQARQLLRAHPIPADAPPDEHVRRLRHVGRLTLWEGKPEAGIPRLQEAVEIAEQVGLPLLEARCRMWLGHTISVASGSAEAEHHLRRAVALCVRHGLPEQQISATHRLSQHLLRLGLRAEAAELLERSLDAAVRAGLPSQEEQAAGTLGYLLIGQGQLDAAIRHLDRTIEMARGHGSPRAMYVALSNRGLARALHDRASDAVTDLEEALAIEGVVGWYRALTLSYLAVARRLGGGGEDAVAAADEARAACEGLDHPNAPELARWLTLVGDADPAAIAEQVGGYDGGAEVEGVVLGLRRIAGRS